MCQPHHKIIDDNPKLYTVSQLKGYRNNHETMVRTKLNHSHTFYNHLLSEFEKRILEINFNWLESLPQADWALKIDEYNKLHSLINWINSRDWIVNNQNTTLESSFKELSNNLYNTLKIFEKHSITIQNYYVTEKFYKNEDSYFDSKLRKNLEVAYDNHIYTLIDLTINLAENFNTIFRIIRKEIDSNFLLQVGIIPSLHAKRLI